MNTLRGSVAVTGVGTFGCGVATGFTELELLGGAAQRAVADAGLSMQDIDGLCTANLNVAMWPLNVVEYLGIRPGYIEGTNVGGSAFVLHMVQAALALEAGLCTNVLVCYGSAQRSGVPGRRAQAIARNSLDPAPYERPYKPFNPPSSYALIAARHMHQYGTTRRHLAEVAVAARQWATLNAEAYARTPLTIDEVLSARMISDPFTVHDCCLVTDGGGAFVMTRSDRARAAPQPPVWLLGHGAATWHRTVSCMTDLTVTPAAESGPKALAMAGLSVADIDVVQIYDAFTISTILALEDLGFCPKGEGGPFVADGGIAPSGRLAVNTNGGGLSCVQPNMYGVFAVIEAVRQLRGGCGSRQVAGAQTALINGNGGNAAGSQVTAILGTSETLQ